MQFVLTHVPMYNGDIICLTIPINLPAALHVNFNLLQAINYIIYIYTHVTLESLDKFIGSLVSCTRSEQICLATRKLYVSTEQICWATCKLHVNAWSDALLKCATHKEHTRILKNNYWYDKPHLQYNHAGKWVVANYVVLSITLSFAGIGTPNKFDGKYAALNWRSPTKPLWC